MNSLNSSKKPQEPNPSRYLLDLDQISRAIDYWLHSIPMTTGLADQLEAVTELANKEMKSFQKIALQFDHLDIDSIASNQNEMKIITDRQPSIILETPSMTPLNKCPSTHDTFLTPPDRLKSLLDEPEALSHLFNTSPDKSSPTPMPQTALYKSCEGLLNGPESQQNNKRGRTNDEDERTDPSPRRSARLACSTNRSPARTVYPPTPSALSGLRRAKKQKIHTAAIREGQAAALRPQTASPIPTEVQSTPGNHSSDVSLDAPPQGQRSAITIKNGSETPRSVASPMVNDQLNSFWIQKIDLYQSESVQRQAILATEVAAIYQASVVLVNALARGSCTHFDPDELLSHPVTFSSLQQPHIREWCQRPENQQLFTPDVGAIWYQPHIFNFHTISTSSPPKGLPIHERYLWDTLKIFHNPSSRLLERSMHYVLAALVLIGTDANKVLPPPDVLYNTSAMSCGTRNAVTCWQHFKQLSSVQSETIQEKESASRDCCIQDLDRFIILIYTMIETFASIWASATLNEEIASYTNRIANGVSLEAVEAFTIHKDELTRTRSQITISHDNLPALVSFLCSGVKGLMIYPKDKRNFTSLRALNFLLVTSHLAKPGQAVEENIWKRTQSYIVGFMKAVIQSSSEWVPCELNRYHLAKALFLDFSDFYLARSIRTISIPTTRNYKVTDKECT